MDRISALMDGEAGQTETQLALKGLKQDESCSETWATFHLIGDIMRGDGPLRDDFMARFRTRIEQEPTQLAPRLMWRRSQQYVLSAAASLCAVAVVLALVMTDNPLRPQVPIAAVPKTEAPIVAQTDPRTRPLPAANQGKVNGYLMAHQEFSPSTALQGVVPYVRTVSESHDGSSGR